jgi:ABC transporter substrate binding protein
MHSEKGLRELGYVEGRNIFIDYRWAEGMPDRLPTLAAELTNLRVQVIVTQSNAALAALQQATRTIPIVVAGMGDPVESGFVASLARPGGNITGFSNQGRTVCRKVGSAAQGSRAQELPYCRARNFSDFIPPDLLDRDSSDGSIVEDHSATPWRSH